jgi:hypothetical protein
MVFKKIENTFIHILLCVGLRRPNSFITEYGLKLKICEAIISPRFLSSGT